MAKHKYINSYKCGTIVQFENVDRKEVFIGIIYDINKEKGEISVYWNDCVEGVYELAWFDNTECTSVLTIL